MSIRTIFIGVVMGLLVGGVYSGVAPPALRPIAAYADDCFTYGYYFTGSYSYAANTGASRAWINTTNYPSFICSNDNRDISYWVMVNGTDAVHIYAQVGWFVEGSSGNPTTPHVFAERSYTDGYDPGAIIYNQIANTSAHTYEVQVYTNTNPCGSPGSRAGFWFDNNWLDYMCTDWGVGYGVQMASESHVLGDRLGGVEFGDTRYCTQSSPGTSCRANTTYAVSSSNDMSPANPYGCYLKYATNDFHIYDSRGNGGHC